MRYSICYEIERYLRELSATGFNQVTGRYLHLLFDDTKVVPGTLKVNTVYTEDGEKYVFSAGYGKNGRVDIWVNKDDNNIVKEVNIFTDGELISLSRNHEGKYKDNFYFLASYFDAKACNYVKEQLDKKGAFEKGIISAKDFENCGVFHDSIESYDISNDDAAKESKALPNCEIIIEHLRSLVKTNSDKGNLSLNGGEYISNLKRITG